MSPNSDIKELIDKDLKGFTVCVMFEVYKTNDDGLKTKSIGFFKNANIAEMFAGVQVDKNWHKTKSTLVLTNGIVGYEMNQPKPIKLFDDEAEALKLREIALSKLSPGERSLLGLNN